MLKKESLQSANQQRMAPQAGIFCRTQNAEWDCSQRVKKQSLIVFLPHLHIENNAILHSAFCKIPLHCISAPFKVQLKTMMAKKNENHSIYPNFIFKQ